MKTVNPLLLGLVAFLFFAIVGGWFTVPPMVASYRLAQSFVITNGTVTEVFPSDHCGCTYTFTVNAQLHQNRGSSCCSTGIGQTMTIYYSPSNPTISLNHPPIANFYNDLIPFSLALVVFPLLTYFMQRRQLKRLEDQKRVR